MTNYVSNTLYCSCGVLAFSVMLGATEAFAATVGCIPGDCSGYTKTSSQCSGKTAIRCPFDTSKYYCQDDVEVSCGEAYKYDCSGPGYIGGVGEPCNDMYASCECDTDDHYEWSGGTCRQNCSGYYYSCTGSNESPNYYDSCGGYYKECDCMNGTYWNGSSCGKAEVVLEVCVSLPYCGGSDCFSRTPSVGGSVQQSGGTYKSFDSPGWGETRCTDFTVNALEPVTISFYGMRETEQYWVGFACLLPKVSAQAGYLSCEPGTVYDYNYIQATFQPDRYTAKNTVNISYDSFLEYQNACSYGNAKVDYSCSVSSSYY